MLAATHQLFSRGKLKGQITCKYSADIREERSGDLSFQTGMQALLSLAVFLFFPGPSVDKLAEIAVTVLLSQCRSYVWILFSLCMFNRTWTSIWHAPLPHTTAFIA